MSKPGAELLRAMLKRNHRLAEQTVAEHFPLACFEHLQQWQLQRLTITFDDLYRHHGYRHAVEFFVSDLYGGLDFRQRDQEMERVAPVMIRFLPDRAWPRSGRWKTRTTSWIRFSTGSGWRWSGCSPASPIRSGFWKAAIEMFAEVGNDLFFDASFEEHQHEPETGLDANFAFAHRDGAVHAGPVEMDVIAMPVVLDIEFLREVGRQAVGSGLGVFAAHVMFGVHVDVRHRFTPRLSKRHSVVGRCPRFQCASEQP